MKEMYEYYSLNIHQIMELINKFNFVIDFNRKWHSFLNNFKLEQPIFPSDNFIYKDYQMKNKKSKWKAINRSN